jgi:hypothetical protein
MITELRLQPAAHWQDYGITVEWIEEKAEWMRRDSGSPGAIDGFFDCAGRLMRLCAYDYYLVGPMFFHTVIGLEAMLRVHYKATDKNSFSELLAKAVEEKLFHDGIFSDIRPFHEVFLRHMPKGAASHAEKLASLLPSLRNEYLHGIYQFHPDYLHLAIQVREMADVLTMPRMPGWKSGR